MKRFVIAAFLVIAVATIMTVGETRTTSNVSAYQQGQQPLFLDFIAQYDLVPVSNTQLGFQNPVRIRNINYPWVLVSPANAPRQGYTEIWVNMDHISVVTKHR
ncbi:MAG TPA: hypothetical protein VKD91_22815 [Pyrinomonadaceae bacterium]|nr:hypothetical protein [Pyrinomonadaceae bacterium]